MCSVHLQAKSCRACPSLATASKFIERLFVSNIWTLKWSSFQSGVSLFNVERLGDLQRLALRGRYIQDSSERDAVPHRSIPREYVLELFLFVLVTLNIYTGIERDLLTER